MMTMTITRAIHQGRSMTIEEISMVAFGWSVLLGIPALLWWGVGTTLND